MLRILIACLFLLGLSSLPARAAIVGDCQGDGVTSHPDLTRALQLALALRGAPSCPAADATGDAEVTVSDLVLIARSMNEGVPVPAIIGPDGGRVVVGEGSGRVEIDVPQSALAAPIAITASPLTTFPFGGFLAGLELGPSGTVFNVPVRVRFKGAGAAGWGWLATTPGVDDEALVPEWDGADAVLEVSHFSRAGIGACPFPASSLAITSCVQEMQRDACAARQTCANAEGGVLPCVAASLNDKAISCYADIRHRFEGLTSHPPTFESDVDVDFALVRNSRPIEDFIDWLAIVTDNSEERSDLSSDVRRLAREGSNLSRDTLRLSVGTIMAYALATGDWTKIRRISPFAPSLYTLLAQDEHLSGFPDLVDERPSLLEDLQRIVVARPYIEGLVVQPSVNGTARVKGFATVRMANTPIDGPVEIYLDLVGAELENGETTGTVITAADGSFATVIRPTRDTVRVEVTASWYGLDPGDHALPVTDSANVTYRPQGLGRLVLCVEQGASGCVPGATIPSGSAATVLAVAQFNGRNVPLVRASFSADGGGTLSPDPRGAFVDGSAAMVFTAPSAKGSCRVTAVASLEGQVVRDSVEISVTGPDLPSLAIPVPDPAPPPPEIRITPARKVVDGGGSAQFAATVSGLDSPSVRWSVEAPAGSIASDGTFTAGRRRGRYRVRATSVQDPLVFGEAEVEVQVVTCGGPPGDIELSGYTQVSTQGEVEALRDVSVIHGGLCICSDPSQVSDDPITSLEPLQALQAVEGSLSITGQKSLASLDGLCGVQHAEILEISRNESLRSFTGLSHLASVETLYFTDNVLSGTVVLSGVQSAGNVYVLNGSGPARESAPWTLVMPDLASVTGTLSVTPDGPHVGVEMPALASVGQDLMLGGTLVSFQAGQLGSIASSLGIQAVNIVDLTVVLAPAIHVGGNLGIADCALANVTLAVQRAYSLRVQYNIGADLHVSIGTIDEDALFGGNVGGSPHCSIGRVERDFEFGFDTFVGPLGNEGTPLGAISLGSCGRDVRVRYNTGICDQAALSWAESVSGTRRVTVCCNTCESGGD